MKHQRTEMLTGLCPRCRTRRILVRINAMQGAPFRVRTHKCGQRLTPRDIEPLPVTVMKRLADA
jgi:hypothetical protein